MTNYDYYDEFSEIFNSIFNDTNLYQNSTDYFSANDTSAYTTSAYNTSEYSTSAYNTSVYNTTADNASGYNNNTDSSITNGFNEIMSTYMSIGVMLTVIGLTYEVISWCIFKKFRNFRNYVYFNMFLADMLYYVFCLLIIVVGEMIKKESNLTNFLLVVFVCFAQYVSSLCFNFWLLILCYMFYVDYVKVSNVAIRRKYLKSNLFAWGIPFVSGLLIILGSYISSYPFITLFIKSRHAILAILMISNFVLYIKILYFIFRGSEISDKWGCVYKATWIFVISFFILVSSLLQTININNAFVGVGIFVKILDTIILDLYVVIIKGNRELWGEYLKKRSSQGSLVMKSFPKKNIS